MCIRDRYKHQCRITINGSFCCVIFATKNTQYFYYNRSHKTIITLCGILLLTFSARAETIYELDFTTASGNVKNWFETIKWELREDIIDMNLRFEDGKLVIEPTRDELGVMMLDFDEKDYLYEVKKIRIEWGVNQYPLGADWSGPKDKTRNTREAISFMVFFGEKKLDSGFFLAPNLPYFISFFLGKNEDLVKVKENTNLPILRKDFILSEYQIIESRAIGSDCILLILSILTDYMCNKLLV